MWAAPRPFPRGPLPLRLIRIPASCPELGKTNPALGGSSGAFPGRKNGQKNQSAKTTRETTLSPRPQEMTLSPSHYITNVRSRTTGSFQHSAPLSVKPELQQTNRCFHVGIRSTPLLGSWTISASDPSYVPTLPSNVKTSTRVTPQNKVFPYTLLAYTTTSILELEPSQFQVSNHFCCIIHGPLATPWQHHVFLLVPKNG